MMNIQDEMDESSLGFLSALFDKTGNSTSSQFSMYDIGAVLDMDRAEASRITEELMSLGFVEIRSLSGKISLTESGLEKMKEFGGGNDGGVALSLGNGPVISGEERQLVEKITARLKNQSGELGLSFDAMSEFVADLRTLEAQMASSRPKTAIIRECFKSLCIALEKTGASDLFGTVKSLAGSDTQKTS
jgi:hypothetical protein